MWTLTRLTCLFSLLSSSPEHPKGPAYIAAQSAPWGAFAVVVLGYFFGESVSYTSFEAKPS